MGCNDNEHFSSEIIGKSAITVVVVLAVAVAVVSVVFDVDVSVVGFVLSVVSVSAVFVVMLVEMVVSGGVAVVDILGGVGEAKMSEGREEMAKRLSINLSGRAVSWSCW